MIEVRHLTKRYGDHTAVDDLSIFIPAGQVYGFLGPNGAGKTTTMNIMTGCLAASEGQVLIDGHDIYSEAATAKKRIGYLPEQPPLYPDMTPGEYLRFVGRAKGLHGAQLKDRVTAVMEKTRITDMQNRLIRNLSKGYRQRVGIAQAILGDPDVIILDEPMVGLDPAQIIEMRELILELGKSHTVILSSHILSEISMVCDHIMIISHGKLVASGTPEELSRHFSAEGSLQLTIKGTTEQVIAALAGLQGLQRLQVSRPGEAAYDSDAMQPAGQEQGIEQAESTEPEKTDDADADDDEQNRPQSETDAPCTVIVTAQEDLREAVFFACCDARLPILSMAVRQSSLEDVFLEVTTDVPQSEPEMEETYLYGNTFVADTDHPDESQWTQEMLQPLEPVQVPDTQEGEDTDAGNLQA